MQQTRELPDGARIRAVQVLAARSSQRELERVQAPALLHLEHRAEGTLAQSGPDTPRAHLHPRAQREGMARRHGVPRGLWAMRVTGDATGRGAKGAIIGMTRGWGWNTG
ncbi:hypothetical protein MFU01_63280 [Myxococcus fulvus]|uniref:Uncharacterized protein n=1 Tax=Myxococcus fulvus TaxID=33 RepID=A0A511TAT9_MYXFU|nr:hypothetical protein MFU01_63280 [Myxococcus fulvus]